MSVSFINAYNLFNAYCIIINFHFKWNDEKIFIAEQYV